MSTRWERTLYAFAPVKAACGAGRTAATRDAIRAALEIAGLDVSTIAPMDESALADMPEAWLLLAGNDMNDGPFTPYVIPVEAIDEEMKSALLQLDGEALSMVEVNEIDPALWLAWVKVALAAGINEYEDYASALDPDDNARALDEPTVSAYRDRWEGSYKKRGASGLPPGAFDVRFVGATFLFERL